MKIKVIYEDNNFLVIDKPAGLLTHPTHRCEENTLVDWLVRYYPRLKNVGDSSFRPGIVHRLDRDTSGLMLVAKTQQAFFYLKEKFRQQKIHKIYLALVYGEIKEKRGEIARPLGFGARGLRRSTKGRLRDQKIAVTQYRVVKKFVRRGEKYTLIEVLPLTGRTHQIRVHLASIGHPVVGDPLYGRKKKIPQEVVGLKRQFLHAASLEFLLPAGKGMIRLESDLPKELEEILATLEKFQK